MVQQFVIGGNDNIFTSIGSVRVMFRDSNQDLGSTTVLDTV